MSDIVNNVAQVTSVLTTREQRELFLWKFPDVARDDVTQLMKVTIIDAVVFDILSPTIFRILRREMRGKKEKLVNMILSY
jgi:hypothetical protein